MVFGTVLAICKNVAHVRAVVNTLKGINQGETTTAECVKACYTCYEEKLKKGNERTL